MWRNRSKARELKLSQIPITPEPDINIRRLSINFFIEESEEPIRPFRVFRVIMIGDSGSGKTSFVNRIVTGNFNQEYGLYIIFYT